MSRGALMCAEVPLIQMLSSGAASCQDPTSGSQREVNRDGRQCDAASGELQHSFRVYGAEVPADLRADTGQSHRWSQSEQSAARAARVRTSHTDSSLKSVEAKTSGLSCILSFIQIQRMEVLAAYDRCMCVTGVIDMF